MKKLFYLATVIALVVTSCDPLSKTYQQLDSLPKPTQNLVISLTTSYTTSAAAATGIVTTLNSTYGNAPDGTTAAVSYVFPANSAFAPVVTLSSISYTMTSADYTFPGNTYPDLSASAVLNFLAYKYPTPVANQEVVLTYNYYESGYTASSGTITTDAFVYANGAWVKCYTVTPTEYASVNRSLNSTFDSADLSNIGGYLATFLKNDASVALTAKAGDVKYVSYRYANTSQYVLPMYYNGTTWANTPTLTFVKANGAWKLQPIINYTLTTADITRISTGAAGSAAAKTNLASYADFSSAWSTSDMDAAVIECLVVDFPTPAVGTVYKVTYPNYSSPAPNPLSFTWDGSQWNALQ